MCRTGLVTKTQVEITHASVSRDIRTCGDTELRCGEVVMRTFHFLSVRHQGYDTIHWWNRPAVEMYRFGFEHHKSMNTLFFHYFHVWNRWRAIVVYAGCDWIDIESS